VSPAIFQFVKKKTRVIFFFKKFCWIFFINHNANKKFLLFSKIKPESSSANLEIFKNGEFFS